MAEIQVLKGEDAQRLVNQQTLGRPKPSVNISESEDEIYELGMLDVGSFNSVVAVSSPMLNSNGYRSSNYKMPAQDDDNMQVTQNKHSKIGAAKGLEQTQHTTMGNNPSSHQSQRTQIQPSLSLTAAKCLSGGRKKEHNEFNVTLKDNRQIQIKLQTLSNKTGCGAFGQGLAGISLGEEKRMVKGFSSLQGKHLGRTLQTRTIQAQGPLQTLKEPKVQIIKAKDRERQDALFQESITTNNNSPLAEPQRLQTLQHNSKVSVRASPSPQTQPPTPPQQQPDARESRNVSNNVSQLPLPSGLIHVRNRVSSKTMNNNLSPITANRTKDASPNPEEFEASYCREMTQLPDQKHLSSIQIAPGGSNSSLYTQRQSTQLKSKKMLEYLQKQHIIQERFGHNNKFSAAQLVYSNRHLFNEHQMKDLEKNMQRRLFMEDMQKQSKLHQRSQIRDDKYNFLNWKKAQDGNQEGEFATEATSGSLIQSMRHIDQLIYVDQEANQNPDELATRLKQGLSDDEGNERNGEIEDKYRFQDKTELRNPEVQIGEPEKIVSLESDPDYNPNDQIDVLVGVSLHVIRNTANKEKELASYDTSRTRQGETEMIGDISSPTIKVNGAQIIKQRQTLHNPSQTHESQTIKVETRLDSRESNGESELQTFAQNPIISCQQTIKNANFTHTPAAKMVKSGLNQLNAPETYIQNKMMMEVLHRYQIDNQEISCKLRINDQSKKLFGKQNTLNKHEIKFKNSIIFRGNKQCLNLPASSQVTSTVNSKKNLDRSYRKNQEESQASIAQHGSLQQPRYMQTGVNKGTATVATSSNQSREQSNADVSLCSASADVSERKGLPSLSKLFATRLDSVKDLGKQRNQLKMNEYNMNMTQQSFGSQSFVGQTNLNTTQYHRAFPLTTRSSLPRMNYKSGQKVVMDGYNGDQKMVIDQMSNIFKSTISPQIQKSIKTKTKFKNAESNFNKSEWLSHSRASVENDMGLLRKSQKGVLPVRLYQPGPIFTPDVNSLDASMFSTSANQRQFNNQTTRGSVEGVKVLQLFSSTIDIPSFLKPDGQEYEADKQDKHPILARKQVIKKESKNLRKPLRKIQEARREDQGSEFNKILSQKHRHRRASSKKKSKNQDIERLVSSQNSSTPRGDFEFDSPKMSHLADSHQGFNNEHQFGETLKPQTEGFFQSQGVIQEPGEQTCDEDKNADDLTKEYISNEIHNQERIEKRNNVNTNDGTRLHNIVEQKSELAATQGQQRDSIANHKDQLSAENAVAYVAGSQDFEQHTSKTVQMIQGQAVYSTIKTSSQQAARALQPQQHTPSFEEYSLIQNQDTSNGLDSGFKSPDFLPPTQKHDIQLNQSKEQLMASSRQTTNLDETSIKDAIMTSKIYDVESYTKKIKGQKQNDKILPETLKRDQQQGNNIIGEESGESSGLLDLGRSGGFDPIKTLNNFTKKMAKEKAKNKKMLTKQQQLSLIQPRVNGIPMIPDIVVDPKQVIINHDINFETARLISTARSFKEQNEIIRATATTKAYIGRSKLAPLEQSYFFKQPANMMQGRVENCSIAKGSQLLDDIQQRHQDNISFIDFNSLQVFGTGRDSYVFQQSSAGANSLLANDALSASEWQLQQLLQQQKQFMATQKFLDAELLSSYSPVAVQQHPPTESRREHQVVKSPNPMRLDETSPLSTGLGMQSPKHKASTQRSSNNRYSRQQEQVQRDQTNESFHRQFGLQSTSKSNLKSKQAMNKTVNTSMIAAALRQSSLLLSGPAAAEQLVSAKKSLRSVGSDSKSDDEESSPCDDNVVSDADNQHDESQAMNQRTDTLV